MAEFPLFGSLNLFNDSYLTESLNSRTQIERKEKRCGIAPLGQCTFVACRLSPSQKRPNGRRLSEKSQADPRCVTVSAAQVEGQKGRYPDTYRPVFLCVGSGRIIEPDELAFRIVADFADDERVLALPKQEQIVGFHPHNFIRRRQPTCGDVAAGVFRAGAVAEDARWVGRAEGLIFDGGVADRTREHVGGGSGMYWRHETVRDDHARKQPLPPSGLLAALRRPSHEAAQASWEKTARGLQQRSTQLAKRLGKLKEYLGPVTGQRRHRGDELARARVKRAHPYLTKLYDGVMRERRDERIRVQEQERERARQRDKERGRDDRGPGR